MFRWYRNAAKCYAYFGDVSTFTYNFDDKSTWESAFRASSWFTCGWTFQEFVVPISIEFFSREELRFRDRRFLERLIYNITGIPLKAF